jgi:malate dehydrogenase (oxaloacetate-decarboxylating)
MKIPQTYLLELVHRPGSLASALGVVAEMGLIVDGLNAVSRTQDRTVWELTIEMSPGQDEELRSRLNELDIARVVGQSDRVFDRHEGGKIEMRSRVVFDTLEMLHDVYTPGVARVCLAIADEPTLARRYTALTRSVAIVTNGTAILGLGNIGPIAGLPVMEGKAALFDVFGEISGVPILIDSDDPAEIVRIVEAIAPSFGAIQLEDIATPTCFEIEKELVRRLDRPVLHDDQHGTAVVVLAALLGAERRADFTLSESAIGQVGLGAAGLGIARLLVRFGIRELLGADLSEDSLARLERAGGKRADLDEIMERSDVVIATTGVAGLIKPEMVRKGQVIFALSNPDPEIETAVALQRGAAFAADGKNLNNVLAFPGLFRGALDAGATIFTDEMLIAAAKAIADSAEDGPLIPSPLCREVHQRVANAVREAAANGDRVGIA